MPVEIITERVYPDPAVFACGRMNELVIFQKYTDVGGVPVTSSSEKDQVPRREITPVYILSRRILLPCRPWQLHPELPVHIFYET